ncbi:MAG: hypothetical protein UU47_C0005G0042, partial [candidate division TM6 bacterium GW2011_GWE2_41_16]
LTGGALTPSVDTIAAGTLTIGPATATKVEIADTGVVTEVQGTLNVESVIDTAAAGTLIIGPATATKVEIADTGVVTEVQGNLNVEGSIDTIAAGTLTLGGTNATAIALAPAGSLVSQVDIATANAVQTVNIGTGTAAKSITLGGSEFDDTLTLRGTTNINAAASTANTNIGTGTSTGTISIGNTNASITQIGGTITLNSASTGTITIGKTADAGITNLYGRLVLDTTVGATPTGIVYKGSTAAGNHFLHNQGTRSLYLGVGAGTLTTAGSDNVGLGYQAATVIDTGNQSTLIGSGAGASLTTGSDDTFVGYHAGFAAVTGGRNVAVGSGTMVAAASTANGYNVAVGYQAGSGITSGASNVMLGRSAGSALTTESNNIYVGDNVTGTAADSGFIRLGTATQTKLYSLASNVARDNGVGEAALFTGTDGQIGLTSSSRRFKTNIMDMGNTTETLMNLHPVKFNLKSNSDLSDVRYGLIAEEVVEVCPYLARMRNGQAEGVHYDRLPAMLLNEVQKMNKTLAELRARIEVLEQR